MIMPSATCNNAVGWRVSCVGCRASVVVSVAVSLRRFDNVVTNRNNATASNVVPVHFKFVLYIVLEILSFRLKLGIPVLHLVQ